MGPKGQLPRCTNFMGICVPNQMPHMVLMGCVLAWVSRTDPHRHKTTTRDKGAHSDSTTRAEAMANRTPHDHVQTKHSCTLIYSSSSPFLELLLLRDLRRLGAAFLELLLLDFLRRFAAFLLGADFLRDARRRLFGAMVNKARYSVQGDICQTRNKSSSAHQHDKTQ